MAIDFHTPISGNFSCQFSLYWEYFTYCFFSLSNAMSEVRESIEPVFTVLGQGIRDLSFESKIAFHENDDEQPEIDIDIQADGRKLDDDVYEVTLAIRAEATRGGKPLFILELSYMGACQVRNVPTDSLPILLMVQAPALLFPFARRIVADATSDGGFPPLLLQPVDFAALYRRQNPDHAPNVGHA